MFSSARDSDRNGKEWKRARGISILNAKFKDSYCIRVLNKLFVLLIINIGTLSVYGKRRIHLHTLKIHVYVFGIIYIKVYFGILPFI